MIYWILAVLVVATLAHIRFAPSKVDRWHVLPQVQDNRDMAGGVVRRVTTGVDGLKRLDAVARATPRTTVLAGSVAEGQVTYVTRTRVFGFPDYSTAAQMGDDLVIFARLRFGRSDFGVNRARVERWLVAIRD